MLRFLKAFFYDAVSWGLLGLVGVTLVSGLALLFSRYDRLEDYQDKLRHLEYDILLLEKDLAKKTAWAERLESDPFAWEQAAREKMNYLRPDEVLITFQPVQKL